MVSGHVMNTTGTTAARPARGADGAYLFLALACLFTWGLGIPITLAAVRRVTPTPGN